MALRKITYEEYHKIYADHLMRDVDILPTKRIIECEHYDTTHCWYECDEPAQLNLLQLAEGKPIRLITIS